MGVNLLRQYHTRAICERVSLIPFHKQTDDSDGTIACLLGSIFFFIPTSSTMLVGLILIGFGLAPIYPSMLHDTPNRFGSAQSKRLMGFQMAFAYIGSTFLPPLFGLLVSQTSLGYLPVATIMIMMGMLFSTERLNRIIKLNKV